MTAVDLVDAIDALADRLTAAGVRVATDARDLNPPAVLITPPTVTNRFKAGTWNAEWQLLIVAPNAGTRPSLGQLSSLLASVVNALDGEPVTATPYSLTVDGESDPLPAYQLTWSARVR